MNAIRGHDGKLRNDWKRRETNGMDLSGLEEEEKGWKTMIRNETEDTKK